MRIVVTGAAGFVGRNLLLRLKEMGETDVVSVTRDTLPTNLATALARAEFVFHLAGVNRPNDPAEFASGNTGFTNDLCKLLSGTGRKVPLAFASSTQAELDNPYGRSKREAELALQRFGELTGSQVHIFRLTNVFGKWARPNYNSAVATFCHNISRGEPIKINDPSSPLRLVHIDSVVDAFVTLLRSPTAVGGIKMAEPVYETTVGAVASEIEGFAASRSTLVSPRTGSGLTRVLYATYLSYLPPDLFAYDLVRHSDPRGVFVEMLRTPDCGQFSFFTAHPGITRGEHYHHTKTEKFLVIKGTARYGFRHVVTGEVCEIDVKGEQSRIVETVPGWSHNITNIGDDELIVMLWANELFDRDRPDTFAMKVKP